MLCIPAQSASEVLANPDLSAAREMRPSAACALTHAYICSDTFFVPCTAGSPCAMEVATTNPRCVVCASHPNRPLSPNLALFSDSDRGSSSVRAAFHDDLVIGGMVVGSTSDIPASSSIFMHLA